VNTVVVGAGVEYLGFILLVTNESDAQFKYFVGLGRHIVIDRGLSSNRHIGLFWTVGTNLLDP
jgi:hypothetical protein